MAQDVSTARIINYQANPLRDHILRGCRRASCLVYIDPFAYDGFFNSPVGYRAQFCLGQSEVANHSRLFRNSIVYSARRALRSGWRLTDCPWRRAPELIE